MEGAKPLQLPTCHIVVTLTHTPTHTLTTKSLPIRCNQKECKRKELIQIRCDECELVFCIKHRHSQDHGCEGKISSSELCANAAEARLRGLTLTTTTKWKTIRDTNPEANIPSTSCAAEQRSINAGEVLNRWGSESIASDMWMVLYLSIGGQWHSTYIHTN